MKNLVTIFITAVIMIFAFTAFGNQPPQTEGMLQFYTRTWIDANVFSEGSIEEVGALLSGIAIPFEKYAGELYAVTVRMGAVRPDWTTATHILVEQSINRAVVETTITAYDHMGDGGEMPTVTFRYIFIDGRIDSGRGVWKWPE